MPEDMDQIVRMLAGLPENERKGMIQQRMEMFLNMPEEMRINGMKGMVSSINKLSPEESRRVILTRTSVVAAYPDEQRKILLASRMKAGAQLPHEVHTADMKTMEAIMPELSPELRANFMKTQQELMKP